MMLGSCCAFSMSGVMLALDFAFDELTSPVAVVVVVTALSRRGACAAFDVSVPVLACAMAAHGMSALARAAVAIHLSVMSFSSRPFFPGM
jgi:hypothetical protein